MRSIGDSIDAKFLAVTCRQRNPCVFFEYITHAEVVELHAYLSDDHTSTIATLQVKLAGGPLLDLVDNIHSTVFGIRLGDWLYAFLLEIAQSDQLTTATQDGITAEQITWTRMEFTHYNLVVGDCVAFYRYIAYTGLLTFHNADFYVNRVAFHSHLHRGGTEKQVSVIHIQRSDVGACRIITDIHIQLFLVVGVTLVDAQCPVQEFVAIYCIAAKGDIAEEKALPLIHLHLHLEHVLLRLFLGTALHLVLWDIPYCIADYTSITETLFVVICYHFVKVLAEIALYIPALFPEAFSPEHKFPEIVHVMGLFHLALQLGGLHLFVALKDEAVYFDHFATIDVKRYSHTTIGILFHCRIDLHTSIPFVDIVAFYFVHRSAEHVLRDNFSVSNLYLLSQLIRFAFSHSRKCELLHSRTLFEDYFEEYDTALYTADTYLHIFKHTLLPQVLYSSRHLVTGHLDTVSDLESRNKLHHTCVKILRPFISDATNLISLRGQIIEIISFATTYNSLSQRH